MKAISFLFGILFFLPTTVFTQKHSVYFGTGYTIPTTTSVIGSFHTETSTEQNLSTFSKGMVYQGGLQFSVTNNFLLELNVNYLPGFENEKFYTEWDGGYLSYTNSNLSIIPAINIKFDVGNFAPYTKFGVSINFINLKLNSESGNIYSNTKYEYKYSDNYSIGFVGGIGINFSLWQSFIIFTEAQINSLTYYPDKLEITENFGGTKVTTTYELKDKIEYNTSNENVRLKQEFPFSSIAIIAGIRYVL